MGSLTLSQNHQWQFAHCSHLYLQFCTFFSSIYSYPALCFVWIHTAQIEAFTFWWDPQVFTHLPYWFFSCFPSCTLKRRDVSIGTGHWRRMWATDKQKDDKEGAREKNSVKEYRVKEEEATRGACKIPDHRGPCWPLTLIMTSKVTTKVRGCVKVPVRQFTPLLGDDDLMQPPQPVWHDQCCSVPAAPKGHASISNPATQGPLKAPCRQSQWGGGKGTHSERSGKAEGQKGCFIWYPVGLSG